MAEGNSSRGSSTDRGTPNQEDYFMALAFLIRKRSPDPVTKVGACIVNEKEEVVGIGYNSMPRGCERFSWSKNSDNRLERKTFYVCHAELNAIMNCCNLKNCTIYVTLCPCNECAKLIIQSGIKSVKYLSDKKANKDEFKAAKIMLEEAGVTLSQYDSTKIIPVDLSEINADRG